MASTRCWTRWRGVVPPDPSRTRALRLRLASSILGGNLAACAGLSLLGLSSLFFGRRLRRHFLAPSKKEQKCFLLAPSCRSGREAVWFGLSDAAALTRTAASS